jgi:solute:Na+ symporter, SSS family
MAAIAALTLIGTFYTLIGGIRSIIWTDVLQLMVLGGTAVAAVVFLWWRIPASLPEVIEALRHPLGGGGSKLTLLPLGFGRGGVEWSKDFTLLTSLTGFVLLGMAAYGTDQDLAQRVLTCKSAMRGSGSAVLAILLSLPIAAMLMAAGLLLYVFYQRPDLMGAEVNPPEESARVFVSFVLEQMPAGLRGLFLAGLFAVALGSFNSVLNAMSSTLIGDFYRPWRPDRAEEHYVRAGRLAMAMWGGVLGTFAVFCVFWHDATSPASQPLINFALSVMNFAYSGLLAVFLTALFTRRGSSRSVIAALVTGFVVVLALEMRLWQYGPAAWAKFELAFPWRMCIATAMAFAVCVMGRGRRRISMPPAAVRA